jgi:PAS domain S-box-containing protein
MSLKVKLLILFLCIALIPLLFTGMTGFASARHTILHATVERLNAIAELREAQVYIHIDRLKGISREIALDDFLPRALERLEKDPREGAGLGEEMNRYLLAKTKGTDLLSLDLLGRDGKIVASSVPQRIGRDESSKRYYQKALDFEEYVTDFHIEEGDQMGLDISVPIASADNLKEPAGVLVAHYDSKVFSRLLSGDLVLGFGAKTQSKGIGATGETFLAGQEGLMITDSIFIAGAAFNQKVNTYASRKCFQEGREVSGVWKDYRGVDVIGASMCLEIGDFKWMLLSKQDTREAFAPVVELWRLSLVTGGIVLMVVGVVGFAISDFITGPVVELTRITAKVSQGEIDIPIVLSNTRDEIEALGRSFNAMLDGLHWAGKEVQMEINIRKESEEKFRGLVEAAPDAVISINPAGEIILVNAQAEKMFGYSRVELIGKMVEVLMPERFRGRHTVHREKYFSNPRTATVGTEGDLFGMRQNRTEFPIEVSLSFARFSDKLFAISTVRDISARVKTERELREQTEHLRRFQNLTVGRELEMIVLKREINGLLAELGRSKKFEAPGKVKDKADRKTDVRIQNPGVRSQS